MFYKMVYVTACVFIVCFDSVADRKPGIVVTFDNVTDHSIKLLGTNEVKSEINSEIGKKAIDFYDGDSEDDDLINIETHESQTHLLSMKSDKFENIKLIKVTKADGSPIVTIKKKNDTLELVERAHKYILGLYRHSSGSYVLIISDNLKTYLEKEQEVLKAVPGMPLQWKKL